MDSISRHSGVLERQLINVMKIVLVRIFFSIQSSVFTHGTCDMLMSLMMEGQNSYRISRTIRRTFFPKKCDLKSTCVLYAKGKYLFPNL